MPSKKKKSKKKKSSVQSASTAQQNGQEFAAGTQSSFWTVAEECAYYANLGCHIATITRHQSKSHKKHELTCSQFNEMYEKALDTHQWLLGIERFDPSEYHPEDLDQIPEIGLDDGHDDESDQEDNGEGRCMTLTLTNVKNVTTICFVTVWDVDLCGRDGKILHNGWNVTTQQNETAPECQDQELISKKRKCTTFIVLCPPRTFVHLCSLAPNQSIENCGNCEDVGCDNERIPIESWSQVEIESDIQPWSSHQHKDDEHSTLIHFPFAELKDTADQTNNTPATPHTEQNHRYQCIQSENGQLTHFFHGNYHAVDFACPIGTPLYSPVNGTVVNVHDMNNDGSSKLSLEVSGIAATNLFHWNSVMIRANEPPNKESSNTSPLFIEYVHIQSNSCVVKTGDHVAKGQLLCKSGSVGFSPTPHLHLGAYRSGEDGAASVRVRFEVSGGTGKGGDSFLPVAGRWYDEYGLVQSDINK